MKIRITTLLAAVLALFATARSLGQNVFVTASGNIDGITPNGTPFTFASGLSGLGGLAFNSAGDLFAITTSGYLYKFTPNGTESTLATGLSAPQGLACDKAGNVYVSQFNGDIIEITTNGTPGVFADGFSNPVGLTFDTKGDLFIANRYANSVIEINTNGTPGTFASGLNGPLALAFDSSGDLFVGNNGGSIIEIATNGQQSTFASGLAGPCGLAFDCAGNLFEADETSENIYKFTPDGSKTAFASGLNYLGLAIQPSPRLQVVTSGKNFQVIVSMPSPYYPAILQTSTNLVNWYSLFTNASPFTFTDSASSSMSGRFFRVNPAP